MLDYDAKAYVMNLEDMTVECASCCHVFLKGHCTKVAPMHAPDFYICSGCELSMAQ